ncbi:MAG TPA: hypothetical protein VJB96_01480 [Patescibacteria group bacterium]|nr:hypothetical protein [Patescibacteria group bacterium]
MRKRILPIILVVSFLFLFKQNVSAETDLDCRKIFDKESYTCLTDSSACSDTCMKETEKPDGSAYFNSGEIYQKCMKASDCEGKSRACSEQALANFRACGKSGEQPKATEAKKANGPNLLTFFGVNPYQAWLRLREVAEVSVFFASGELGESLEGGFLNLFGSKSIRQKDEEAVKEKERAFESVFGKNWQEQVNEPKIDSKTEERAWEIPAPKQESVTDVPKTPDTKRYSWDTNSGAVITSNDWETIEFKQPVQAGGETIRTVKLDEGEMEVRVRNTKPAENQFGVDAGWLGVTVSRTHFLVLKDTDKRLAAVVVYEGEVKVKTKDGKTVTIKPDGGKPGVVVIAQQLSPVKLAVAGLVFVVIIGGGMLLFKKKSVR